MSTTTPTEETNPLDTAQTARAAALMTAKAVLTGNAAPFGKTDNTRTGSELIEVAEYIVNGIEAPDSPDYIDYFNWAKGNVRRDETAQMEQECGDENCECRQEGEDENCADYFTWLPSRAAEKAAR